MKIRVKEMAFYAGARRRPGDEMDNVPDDLKGGWFDVIPDEPTGQQAKPKGGKPGKQDSADLV